MTTQPYLQPLRNGLTLRTPASREDKERVAAFSGVVFGPEVAPTMYKLLTQHPHMEAADQVFVEDERGQVVSSLCLITRTFSYEGVELSVGELGVCGTLESHRRHGLIRAQVEYFRRRLHERACVLSCIQGIPFFYRQFGYEYALPLEGGSLLELRQVTEADSTFSFRPATLEDMPVLIRLYAEAAHRLTVHTVRSEAVWRYLLAPYDMPDADTHQTLVIENPDGSAAGYMRLPDYHFGEELVVDEVSMLSFGAGLAALHHLKTLAGQRPGIRLNLPAQCELVKLAHALGAQDLGVYAWQIMVPDMLSLLRTIGPALERRLALSMFAGLTREVRLGFYREVVVLRFSEGRLLEVKSESPVAGNADADLPPLSFIPLLMGFRTIEELRHSYPDVNVRSPWQLLLETLFPKAPSFIYTSY